MLMWLRERAPRVAVLIVPALLSACAKNIVATANSLCAGLEVVSVSKRDTITEETARAIEANNVVIEQACA